MMTNSNITIYNKYFNKTTRLDEYKRIVIENVFFEENRASNRLRTGLNSADSAIVLIPFNNGLRARHLPPMEFEGKDNTFTLSVGDRIVKGVCKLEINGKLSELDKRVDAYTIVSVDTRDYGDSDMQHWEVGAK